MSFNLSQRTRVPNGMNFPGNVEIWCHFNVKVDHANGNFIITDPSGDQTTVALAAGLTQDLTLCALPANGYVAGVRVKSVVAVTGVTTATLKLGITGTDNLFLSSAYDLAAAVSATNFAPVTTAGNTIGNNSVAATNLVALVTTTVDNITAMTAGEFDIWFKVGVLSATEGNTHG